MKIMIWDLSDVTSMTLHDTDGARMAKFNNQMMSAIEHPDKDVVAFLSNLVLYYVKPKSKQVSDVWVERLERLKTPTRTLPSFAAADVENLHELLTMLGLERLSPMLDCEWQTI
jgi:hypothetical protein